MDMMLHSLHLEEDTLEQASVNKIDEAVAQARDVCAASTHIAVAHSFYLLAGLSVPDSFGEME